MNPLLGAGFLLTTAEHTSFRLVVEWRWAAGAAVAPDDAGVLPERRLDVEADPVDQRQDGGQSMGIGAFRVGLRRRLEATHLVVFATARAISPLRLVLARR